VQRELSALTPVRQLKKRKETAARSKNSPLPLGPIAQGYDSAVDEVLVSLLPSQHGVWMKLMMRKASVQWKGGSNGGTRAITTESGALKQAHYSLGIPFRGNSGTNPAELIAAAQAASFSLALSTELGVAASASGEIVTTVTVTLEHLASGWTVMNIHLDVSARLPRLTQGEFIDATVRAKTNCLVSRLLRANISMNAKLDKCLGSN
jgi:lipoyl-dependent peroxiredoxin